jgi:dolichol-phosphate mannosyltransferase
MLLSIVIPLYEEEESIPFLLSRLQPIATSIDPDYELVLVNDGSRDNTFQILQAAASTDPHIRILSFSRNFGHQAAVTAGLDYAQGDCVVVMDADLQDPPEILPEMIALYHQGYDIVSPQRIARKGDSWFKRKSAQAFYTLMQKMVDRRIVPEVGDFRLFSRRALIAIRSFREQHRFMRGLVAWLGLSEAIVPFERQERVAGTTKYPLWKMIRFSWTAITSFSGLPLRLTLGLGMFFVLLDAALVVWVLYGVFVLKTVVPGWASLVLVHSMFSGVTLIAIGLMGDYVSRIYDESKNRPLYVLDQTRNLDPNCAPMPRGLALPPQRTKE